MEKVCKINILALCPGQIYPLLALSSVQHQTPPFYKVSFTTDREIVCTGRKCLGTMNRLLSCYQDQLPSDITNGFWHLSYSIFYLRSEMGHPGLNRFNAAIVIARWIWSELSWVLSSFMNCPFNCFHCTLAETERLMPFHSPLVFSPVVMKSEQISNPIQLANTIKGKWQNHVCRSKETTSMCVYNKPGSPLFCGFKFQTEPLS